MRAALFCSFCSLSCKVQYRSKVSYHRLARCVLFLQRLVSRETRHVSFPASALEVPILRFHRYSNLFYVLSYRFVRQARFLFSSAMRVYHVCIIRTVLFASGSRQLLAAFCGCLLLDPTTAQELLCSRKLERIKLPSGQKLNPKELLCTLFALTSQHAKNCIKT